MNSTALSKTVGALAASMFLGVSAAALGQGTPPAQPAPGATMQVQVTASRLIGKNVQNAQNDIIGFVNSVATGADGRVESVIVGVGGFIGVGDRDVEIKWTDLRVSGDGEKISVTMTKDQLAALPEYKYATPAQRGTAFRNLPTQAPNVAQAPDARPTPVPQADATPPTPAPQARSTPDTPSPTPAPGPGATQPAQGGLSTRTLLGLNVYGPQDSTVGSIKDIVLDDTGAAQSAVISVGGILGFGAKDVTIAWNEIRFTRDGDDVKANVPMTVEQLKAMPDSRQAAGGIWVQN